MHETRLSLVAPSRDLENLIEKTKAYIRGANLGYHLKTGHTLSVQNRPTGLAEDVIVLPCRKVRLQGVV
jgi:hypothetical protein